MIIAPPPGNICYKNSLGKLGLRVFQECFKSVSREFHDCFKGVKRIFQDVSRVFEGCYKSVS